MDHQADRSKRVVNVDASPESIGKNYETEVGVPADLKRTSDALDANYGGSEKWDAGEIRARHETWIESYVKAFTSDEFPLRPERMVADSNDVLDDDAVVPDSGTSCPYFAAPYEFEGTGGSWVTPARTARSPGSSALTSPASTSRLSGSPATEVRE